MLTPEKFEIDIDIEIGIGFSGFVYFFPRLIIANSVTTSTTDFDCDCDSYFDKTNQSKAPVFVNLLISVCSGCY